MNDFERGLLESPGVPALPPVTQRLLELVNDSDADIVQLDAVVGRDPGLSAKIIRIASSAMYGVPREITSVRDAAIYLGLGTIRSIALSCSFLSAMHRPGGSESTLDRLWRTSLMKALAARRLASEAGNWEPEEAFLAGLVANCGAVVMHAEVPGYRDLVDRFYAGERDLIELERSALESDHGRLGSLLVERWSFPGPLCNAIRSHFGTQEGGRADPVSTRRGWLLAGADLLARALTVEGFRAEVTLVGREVSRLVGVPGPVVAHMAAELPSELRDSAALFDIPAHAQRSYEELLAEASQQLGGRPVEPKPSARALISRLRPSTREFEDLRSIEGLVEDVDAMTGLFGRSAFERILEVFHRRAQQLHRALSVIILEVENLKSLAATLGPEVVAQALTGISERLETLVRRTDPHARVGAHQLAILAPGCALPDLPHLAERVRVGLEHEPIPAAVGDLDLQLVIGMAASNPHHDGIDPHALLSFACSAVDQARMVPGRMHLAT